MHESSLARGILDAVLAKLPNDEQLRVTEVRGWIGETESLSADSLQMHFTGMAVGTPAQDARLVLSLEHVAAVCNGCGERYLPEHHLTLCPACGSTEGELQGRTGLKVETIEVVGAALR